MVSARRIALCLALVLLAPFPALADGPSDLRSVIEADHPPPMPDLHKMLMEKFDAMNTTGQGIFHEDITASVAPFFPVGQPIAATKRIIAEQKLGALRPFKGTNDPGMGTMFVTRFDLASHVFSKVYVVLDFDFDGSDNRDMKLKMMKAFLRASNM